MKLATLCYVKDIHSRLTLMILRNKKKGDYHLGKWNGLGGKLDPGESPQECAIREIFEESGLTVTNPQLKGIITFPMFDQKDDWYVFMFTASQYSGTLIDSPEGELRWIEDDKLKQLNLWEGDLLFLDWLGENAPFFSAKFIYNNGKLESHQVDFY
jgi:8-oxo-dGTP diphosphatase